MAGPPTTTSTVSANKRHSLTSSPGYWCKRSSRRRHTGCLPTTPADARVAPANPLFGSGTAFGVPALPRLGRPTVGCHLNRWQAQTEGGGKIVRVHQRGNQALESIFDDGTAS